MKIDFYAELKVYRKQEPKSYRLDNGASGNSYSATCDDGINVLDLKFSEDAYNCVENGESYVVVVQYVEAYGKQDKKVIGVIKHLADESQLGTYIRELVRSDNVKTSVSNSVKAK